MEHARDTQPGLTLGVAAFSNVQGLRIEDEVDILRRRKIPPCEEFFAEATPRSPSSSRTWRTSRETNGT